MTCGWHSSCVNPKGKIDPKNDQKIIDRYGQEYSTENYSLSTLPHGDDWKYILDADENKLPIPFGPGIDTASPAEKTVWAALRGNQVDGTLTALVSKIVSTGAGCRKVEVWVQNSDEDTVASFTYVHTLPTVEKRAEIKLPSLGEIAMTPIGTVAYPPGSNNGVDEDGSKCPTTGAHLHQKGNVGTGNLNRAAGDSAKGFPDPGVEPTERKYCSDTWLFKIQSPSTAAVASSVAPCPGLATPVLTAQAGNGQVDVSWTNPNADRPDAVTHHELRWAIVSSGETVPDPGEWSEWRGRSRARTLRRPGSRRILRGPVRACPTHRARPCMPRCQHIAPGGSGPCGTIGRGRRAACHPVTRPGPARCSRGW